MQTSPISFSRLLDIALYVAEELSLRHAAGFVHGQLTPRAIVLHRNGGIKILSYEAFPTGSPQDDQFALGKILLAAIPVTPGDFEPLGQVVERLLAAEPQDRYVSTRDLYLDLRALHRRFLQAQRRRVTVPTPVKSRRPLFSIPLTLLVFSVFVFYLLNHSAVRKRGQAEIQSFPAWSPDREKILFVKSVAGIDQIFVQKRDSAAAVQITHGARPSFNPQWSGSENAIRFQRAGKWWRGLAEPDRQAPE